MLVYLALSVPAWPAAPASWDVAATGSGWWWGWGGGFPQWICWRDLFPQILATSESRYDRATGEHLLVDWVLVQGLHGIVDGLADIRLARVPLSYKREHFFTRLFLVPPRPVD